MITFRQPLRCLGAIALSGLALVGACRRTPAAAPEPSSPPATRPVDEPRDDADAGAPRRSSDSEERERIAREERERVRRLLAEAIHFEFDRSDLTQAARDVLDAKVGVLSANPGIALRIEGHADERGSDEYNLALGMRRASAARRYLVQHGIGEDRIDVTSMGEEHPVCQSSGEPCWAQNRRAEFVAATPE